MLGFEPGARDELDGRTTTCVLRAFAGVVRGDALLDIDRIACVKSAVSARQHIHKIPWHSGIGDARILKHRSLTVVAQSAGEPSPTRPLIKHRAHLTPDSTNSMSDMSSSSSKRRTRSLSAKGTNPA